VIFGYGAKRGCAPFSDKKKSKLIMKKALLVAMLGYLGYHCWPVIFIFGVAPSTHHSNFSGRVFVYYHLVSI